MNPTAGPPEARGNSYEIRCLKLADGSCPAGEFLSYLPRQQQLSMKALFDRVAERGNKFRNAENFSKMEGSDEIYHLTKHGIRIFCFSHESTLYLLFGIKGRTTGSRKADVKRAEGYRRWFLEQLTGET